MLNKECQEPHNHLHLLPTQKLIHFLVSLWMHIGFYAYIQMQLHIHMKNIQTPILCEQRMCACTHMHTHVYSRSFHSLKQRAQHTLHTFLSQVLSVLVKICSWIWGPVREYGRNNCYTQNGCQVTIWGKKKKKVDKTSQQHFRGNINKDTIVHHVNTRRSFEGKDGKTECLKSPAMQNTFLENLQKSYHI